MEKNLSQSYNFKSPIDEGLRSRDQLLRKFKKKSKLKDDNINNIDYNNELEVRIHQWLDDHQVIQTDPQDSINDKFQNNKFSISKLLQKHSEKIQKNNEDINFEINLVDDEPTRSRQRSLSQDNTLGFPSPDNSIKLSKSSLLYKRQMTQLAQNLSKSNQFHLILSQQFK